MAKDELAYRITSAVRSGDRAAFEKLMTSCTKAISWGQALEIYGEAA